MNTASTRAKPANTRLRASAATSLAPPAAALEQRLALLLHPSFLIALALLILNDSVLKPLLHNALTGKLSDFAGVFAFAYFCSALAGARHAAIHALVGIAFAIWKSPLSQGAIDAWNAFAPMPIARVVDAGDLIALLVLPWSWWLLSKTNAASGAHAGADATRDASADDRAPLPTRIAKFVVAGIAVVAFTATSRGPVEVGIEADYLTAQPPERVAEIGQSHEAMRIFADMLLVTVKLPSCESAEVRITAHAQPGKTVLRLRRVEARCAAEDIQREDVLTALDPVLAKHFGARRVKEGMGVLGEAARLSPKIAQYCPPEADQSPRPKTEGASDYPPKSRRREPAQTQAPTQVPAQTSAQEPAAAAATASPESRQAQEAASEQRSR
jgi:hypothetical protein